MLFRSKCVDANDTSHLTVHSLAADPGAICNWAVLMTPAHGKMRRPKEITQ